jgi:hypothetical protein
MCATGRPWGGIDASEIDYTASTCSWLSVVVSGITYLVASVDYNEKADW